MDEIEKKAEELAQLAVKVRLAKYAAITKSAAPVDPMTVLKYGLGGAGIGAAGAGAISMLANRKRERVLRDILLGGLVGGAGGAAVPLLKEAPTTIRSWFTDTRTPEEQKKEMAASGSNLAKKLRGTTAGEGSQGVMAGAKSFTGELLGGAPVSWKTFAVPAVGGALGYGTGARMAQPGVPWREAMRSGHLHAKTLAMAPLSAALFLLGERLIAPSK